MNTKNYVVITNIKKSDKEKLEIALKALEDEIISKNDQTEYSNAKESNHLVAKLDVAVRDIVLP